MKVDKFFFHGDKIRRRKQRIKKKEKKSMPESMTWLMSSWKTVQSCEDYDIGKEFGLNLVLILCVCLCLCS
jgi:hypothetical protein